jgi:hypothetical protein
MEAPQMSNKTERRKDRRSRPQLLIQGVDLTSGATVQLRDFSSRSFAVEGPESMADKAQREFEFPLGLGRIAFKGVPKRSERLPSVNGQPRYLVAFEFTWRTPEGKLAVQQFVRGVRGEVA